MNRIVLAILSFVLVFAAGCTNQELQRIEDASSKRAMICSAVDELAQLSPSVYTTRAQQACKAGADLQLIARAYGGCYEVPAESGGSSTGPVVPPPAPAPEPAPVVPAEPAPTVPEGG